MFFLRFFAILLAVGICSRETHAYKIIVAGSMPARSHHNLGKGLADILHEGGHEVTFIAAYASDKPKYREIVIPGLEAVKDELMGDLMSMNNDQWKLIGALRNFSSWFDTMSNMTFYNPKIQQLIKSNEKFDLLVLHSFLNDEFMGLAVRFDCPIILSSSISVMQQLAVMTGNPISPESVPNIQSPFGIKMNLWQRSLNVVYTGFFYLLHHFVLAPGYARRYELYFPEEASRFPYSDMYKKVAMVLSNSHTSIQGPRILLPNVAEIGGFHIGDAAPLDQELKKLLDDAEDGVIFFSMGSNVKTHSMSLEMRSAILTALGRLKETVVWKFEKDLPDKPKNVFISKWLPQSGILAHKNVKFFITHGGLLSRTEAIKYGVPLLCIPVAGDQQSNAQVTVDMGHGIQLGLEELTEETFSASLQEMLTNPKYKETATRLAKVFADRPVSPKELVLFSAEHVIRTKGAGHLTPPPLLLHQRLLLDVVVVMLLPLAAAFILLKVLVKRCLGEGKKKIKTH